MTRQLVLVGIFVVGPFARGSMMQLALATVFCIAYLVLQLQAMPYNRLGDDYLALACSFSLSILFLT